MHGQRRAYHAARGRRCGGRNTPRTQGYRRASPGASGARCPAPIVNSRTMSASDAIARTGLLPWRNPAKVLCANWLTTNRPRHERSPSSVNQGRVGRGDDGSGEERAMFNGHKVRGPYALCPCIGCCGRPTTALPLRPALPRCCAAALRAECAPARRRHRLLTSRRGGLPCAGVVRRAPRARQH